MLPDVGPYISKEMMAAKLPKIVSLFHGQSHAAGTPQQRTVPFSGENGSSPPAPAGFQPAKRAFHGCIFYVPKKALVRGIGKNAYTVFE